MYGMHKLASLRHDVRFSWLRPAIAVLQVVVLRDDDTDTTLSHV